MSELTIEVHARQETGKNFNRRLRASGQLPAVVYGAGKESVPIRVETRKVEDLLKIGGENTVFLLKLSGTDKSRHTMIRELQTDPINGQMIHIDFQRVLMDQKVRVAVPIELIGDSVGVRTEGGFLDFVTRQLEVECLPGEIPGVFQLDVAPLHVGQHVEAQELELPASVTLLDEPQRVIVSVAHRKGALDEEEEEEELLTAAAEEPELVGESEESS